MRVVVANAFEALVGGTEHYVRELLPALRGRGHEVGLLFEFPADGGRGSGLAGGEATSWCARDLGRSEAIRGLHGWKPDVVLVNKLMDPVLEEALAASFPSILFAHDYHGTCATGEKRVRFPSSLSCIRGFGAPCLAVNYLRACGARDPVALLRNFRLQSRRHALLPRWALVVVASAHMREEMIRNGVARDRVVVNPLWPTDIVRAEAPPEARPFTNRIAFLGRLTGAKGPAVAVAAVDRARRLLDRPLRLFIAGEGPERESLGRVARGNDAVRLLGWVEGAARRSLLEGVDLLVVPSLWPEPFGLVGLEAASVGTPSAAFDSGGVREWLIAGLSGELATPASPRSLADAIVRALRTTEHHDRLRRGAWHHASGFTRERHVGVLEETLLRAVRGEAA